MIPLSHGSFTMERTFAHRPSRVFRAWSDPGERAAWFRGPPGWESRYTSDFRAGGWERNDSVPPGGMNHRYASRLAQVVADTRLLYTFEMWVGEALHSVSVASVELHEDPRGCRMVYTEHIVFVDAPDALPGRRAGTEALLDNLAGLLERETSTSRRIPAPPERVWAAMVDPARLHRWWGPDGFTNTYEVCDVRPGGDWVLTMHGPDGTRYPNRLRFLDVEPGRRLRVDHLNAHRFVLDVRLDPDGDGTLVTWMQRFETAEECRAVLTLVGPANEQNLDRLGAEVLG